MRWAFFIDANLEPRTAETLRKEGYRAEYSDYVSIPDKKPTSLVTASPVLTSHRIVVERVCELFYDTQ